MNKITKPKRHTSYYYDYMQEVRPWLKKMLPKSDKSCVENELWDAICESTGLSNDTTVYLCFEVLESYLEDCLDPGCVEGVMALLRELVDEEDTEGINIEISW